MLKIIASKDCPSGTAYVLDQARVKKWWEDETFTETDSKFMAKIVNLGEYCTMVEDAGE